MQAARLSVGGPVSTPTAKPAAFKSSAPKGIDAYGYGPLGSVPAPPPLSVLAAPAPEQPVEGREEWAIRSNIAQPGEWETVTPSSQSSMAAKDQHKKTDTATTHDQKPEFQDDEAEDEEDLRNFKIREKELPLETDGVHHSSGTFGSLEGWLMVLLSSVACVVGASVVFIDNVWHRDQGSILESRAFLAGSMALASGVLLFSSLVILLPEAKQRLHSDWLVHGCFFIGAAVTLLLTRIIHWCTPNAIHACGANPHLDSHSHEHSHQDEEGSIPHNDHHADHHGHSHDDNERGKLLHQTSHDSSRYGSTPFREAHFRLHRHDDDDHDDDELSEMDHRQFFSMGIQTAVAICVHKFPEGLIMFVSSQASTSLGLSVCVAMSIHNLTEGFMIALPLYLATRSRIWAFAYAAFLGGLSQPLGAVMGLVAIRNVSEAQENMLFGITFALSMLPQAIKAQHEYVVSFFFMGVFLVGVTSALESLHS
ncbi:ZIP zinc transporter-domain-containing protein [Radiomyces spectabilis]|uniref:ZIP zinc transporter-domain-containing protein n=1 Tax=Radiomyces spectabilis TaxID=64574 RepID=UPI00221F6336|nr:ZIP zinc transporter-domain-containing protein [Radiomyces spectabilis]KAI8384958.1 ZIP zinc transporter-domain-containing protein [Radiomyces spectabilis]